MRPNEIICVNSTNIDIFHLFSGVLSVARVSLVYTILIVWIQTNFSSTDHYLTESNPTKESLKLIVCESDLQCFLFFYHCVKV